MQTLPAPPLAVVTPPTTAGWLSAVWSTLTGSSGAGGGTPLSLTSFDPDCGCEVSLPIDFLQSYADPASRLTVPSTLMFSIPCLNEGAEIIVHQDDRTSSPIAGASWYGWVDGAPSDRVEVTRLDGVYVATLMLGDGAWEIQGLPGQTGRAYCDLPDIEEDEDTALPPPSPSPPPPPGGVGGCPETSADWPEVDMLVVYTDKARVNRGGAPGMPADNADIRALAAHGVATTYDSLRNSDVEVQVRAVGIAPTQYDDSTGPSACRMRRQGTAEADVQAALAASGADAVLVMGADVPTNNQSGCAGTARWEDLGGTMGAVNSFDRRIGAEIGTSATGPANLWKVTSHEFGHMLGICHSPYNGCSVADQVPEYAFGYISQQLTGPNPYHYRTVMATQSQEAPCGGLNEPPCPHRNFYATPSMIFPDADVAGIDASSPRLGSDVPYHLGTPNLIVKRELASNAKRALEMVAPYASAQSTSPPNFRHTFDPNGPQPWGQLTCLPSSPPGTCHFAVAWTAPAAATFTRIQAVAPGAPLNVLYDSGNLTTGSHTVQLATATLPSPLRLRLWSLFPATAVQQTPAWAFEEFTFNVGGAFVDCAVEDAFVVPYAAFDGASCTPPAGPRCQEVLYDSSTGATRVDCDLGAAVGTQGGLAMAITPRRTGFTAYDLALMGTDPDGSPFCCLHYTDDRQDFKQVVLRGSTGDDRLSFQYPPYSLRKADSCLETSWASGRAGEDTLLGSADPRLRDLLWGGPDADVLLGDDGDDRVRGWRGPDMLYGQSGNDVLIEEIPGAADELYGNDGDDVVCAIDVGDLFVTSEPPPVDTDTGDTDVPFYVPPTDVDTIYVSDAGTQTAWHPDSTSHGASLECGHVDYQVLGGPPECPLTWLTTPPGACDDLLP